MFRTKPVELRSLCLDSIVYNFDSFMAAYRSKNSGVPERYLEYLQRVETKELLYRLTEEAAMKDSYFSFLMNPYLDELDFDTFTYKNLSRVLKNLTRMGKSIKYVNMRGKVWPEEQMYQVISLVPEVEVLHLGNECSDRILKLVGENCHSLAVLNVSECFQLTDAGVLSLCLPGIDQTLAAQNTRLCELYISHTKISEQIILFCLTSFPALRVFEATGVDEVVYQTYISHYENGSLDCIPKYGITNLKITFLCGCYISAFQKKKVSCNLIRVCALVFPNVTNLEVYGMDKESEVIACANFTMADSINFNLASSAEYGLPVYVATQGSKLKALSVCGGKISVLWISDCCQKLERLSLDSVTFLDSAYSVMSKKAVFPFMQELSFRVNFNDPAVTESVCFLISSSPELTELSLNLCESLSDHVVNALLRNIPLSKLKEFEAAQTDLNCESARKIISLVPNLERLSVHSTTISAAEYICLVHLLFKERRNVAIEWCSATSLTESCEGFRDLDRWRLPSENSRNAHKVTEVVTISSDDDDDDDDFLDKH